MLAESFLSKAATENLEKFGRVDFLRQRSVAFTRVAKFTARWWRDQFAPDMGLSEVP